MLRHGAWLARRLRRPFVLTVHDYMRPQEKLRIDWGWCRRIITVSESVRRDFTARTEVPPDRIVMIHSGINVSIAADARPPLAPGQVPVVGTAGPLEAVKGLPFFLGAARKVLDTGRDVEFLVAGAGPEEANLRRMSRDLGLADKVTFVPYVLDFTESLTAMDIFCLPSLQQGLGTIMLEAMALGRPVIASRVGGVYSVVHEQETGLLVPPSNSSRLADRILELLADPPRARAIGEAARQMVRREFGLEKMVAQTADLYRGLVAESHPQPVAP
jgi:glycosyltransferase involved in cell wall biosynthesis